MWPARELIHTFILLTWIRSMATGSLRIMPCRYVQYCSSASISFSTCTVTRPPPADVSKSSSSSCCESAADDSVWPSSASTIDCAGRSAHSA